MKLVAYVNRYSHITLTEALSVDLAFLGLYSKAIAAIVEEENKPSGA